MKENIDRIAKKLKEVYFLTGVPLCYIIKSENQRWILPEMKSEELHLEHLQWAEKILNKYKVPLLTPFVYIEQSKIMFGFLRLSTDLTVIVGPTPMLNSDIYSQLNYIKENHAAFSTVDYMKMMYSSSKVDTNYFYHIMIHLADLLCNRVFTMETLMISRKISHKNDHSTDLLIPKNELSVQQYSVAQDIFNSIKAGNIEKLRADLDKDTMLHKDSIPYNSLLVIRYTLNYYMAIICHYASLGGVAQEKISKILTSFVQIMREAQSSETYRQLFSDMAIELCQNVKDCQEKEEPSDIITQAVKYIKENIYSMISLSELEAYTHATSKTITRHFKRYLNTTPAQYISDIKLEEASYLLKETDMKIIEIANLLNYSSQTHLNKNFQKKYLCTPLQYRTRNYQS